MIDKGPVLLDIADGIARLRLNRPDAANGMSVELLSALCDAIMACHGHPDLRVVLLSGEGTNFCAGGDVRAFASKGEKLPDYIRQATAYLQNAVTGLLRLEAPVIASVQGFAAGGGGFGLVCASDIVIAAESAKFLAGATRVGDGAGCRCLRHAVAAGRPAPGDVDPADQSRDPGGGSA